MFHKPIYSKKKKSSCKKKGKKEKYADSLFSGYVVSRKRVEDCGLMSPVHRKFTQRMEAQNVSNFRTLRNRFNQRQEQVYDRNRVEELNRGVRRGPEVNSVPSSFVQGNFIRQSEVPRFNAFTPNISKEVSSFSSRQGTPPKTFFVAKKFIVSPQPHIFKKYKKSIPSVGENDKKSTSPKFAPRIMKSFTFGSRKTPSPTITDDVTEF